MGSETNNQRPTCMCKRCANMNLMNKKLAAERVTTTVESMKLAVCHVQNSMYVCMASVKHARGNKYISSCLHVKEVEYQQ